jgi:hypothetical protein
LNEELHVDCLPLYCNRESQMPGASEYAPPWTCCSSPLLLLSTPSNVATAVACSTVVMFRIPSWLHVFLTLVVVHVSSQLTPALPNAQSVLLLHYFLNLFLNRRSSCRIRTTNTRTITR